MSLSEFHATISDNKEVSEANAAPSSMVRINWADEMEALDDGDSRNFFWLL